MSRSHLEQIHERIKLTRPKQAEHDFLIYTDGSGREQDGWGGAAAIVQRNRPFLLTSRVLAQNHVGVQEMELQGLLLGLGACLDIYGRNKSNIKQLEAVRPHVWWVTDRENLALNLWVNPDTGTHYYKRREPYHLWRTLSFYEELFQITPVFTHRAKIHYQHKADKLAGFGRSLMKHERTKFMRDNPDIPE